VGQLNVLLVKNKEEEKGKQELTTCGEGKEGRKENGELCGQWEEV